VTALTEFFSQAFVFIGTNRKDQMNQIKQMNEISEISLNNEKNDINLGAR